MDTDKHGLIHEELTREIIGCSIEVLNELGHGLLEKPYENALAVEFRIRKLKFSQQPRFNVSYKGEVVGEYVPDIIVEHKVVVDTKVVDHISDHEVGQMLNYLKVTKIKVGLIINFRKSRLEWKRVVL